MTLPRNPCLQQFAADAFVRHGYVTHEDIGPWKTRREQLHMDRLEAHKRFEAARSAYEAYHDRVYPVFAELVTPELSADEPTVQAELERLRREMHAAEEALVATFHEHRQAE
jgi:hypothetical protein